MITKKYILKILTVIIPLLSLIIFLEIQYRKIPNDYMYKSHYIQNKGREIEILILGSSHSYLGVNPAYFDKKCFNFAFVAQSIKYDAFILNKYSEHLQNIQYIILPISYRTFTYKEKHSLRKYMYVYHLGYDKLTFKEKTSIHRYLSITLKSRITTLNEFIAHKLYKINKIKCNQKGFFNFSEVHTKQLDLIKTAKRDAEKHEDYSYNLNENMHYVNKIINICYEKDCKLILFTPPATQYYIDFLNPVKWEMIIKKCKSIEKDNLNVHYVNFLEDTDFTDSSFRDGSHLNEKGSKILSGKLNEIIGKIENIMY